MDVRQPVHFLTLHVAIEDVRQDKGAAGIFAEQLGDGAAHGAEAEQRDFEFARGAGLRPGLCGSACF